MGCDKLLQTQTSFLENTFTKLMLPQLLLSVWNSDISISAGVSPEIQNLGSPSSNKTWIFRGLHILGGWWLWAGLCLCFSGRFNVVALSFLLVEKSF